MLLPARGKGVDGDGNEVAAVPAAVTIKWVTGAGEVAAKGWDELAAKLKVPFKNEGSAAFQKVQVLNALGAEGWELLETSGGSSVQGFAAGDRGAGGRGGVISSASHTWLLKRRVP